MSNRTPLRRPASTKSLRAPSMPTARSPSPSKPQARTPARAPKVAASSKPKVDEPKAAPALSIKDAIALKRAEARKATQVKVKDGNTFDGLEDADPNALQEEEDVLGRKSIRETIERARSTGSLNLSARSLPCIPSPVFEIILGVTPEKLASVSDEPPLPPPSPHKASSRNQPTWYEAQDLVVLKAWNNEIGEIQPEISLFGSLKTVDLHSNKLKSLPDSFVDLANLTSLDLSHNQLSSLPEQLFTLPELSYLNVSHNVLTSLRFKAPFASAATKKAQSKASDFFASQIVRADRPLPHLVTLEARNNKITADSMDFALPPSLSKLDLSENPLESDAGLSQGLIKHLAQLPKLKELWFENADIGDSTFNANIFDGVSKPFPALQLLHIGETRVTSDDLRASVAPLTQDLNFSNSSDNLVAGSLRVIVGKRDLREAWEIEVEQKQKTKAQRIEARSTPQMFQSKPDQAPSPSPKNEMPKESWEIEAEQGLLTEAGRRKARALAAAKAEDEEARQKSAFKLSTSGAVLESPQYYNSSTHTLTLPPSTAVKQQHNRAFSAAGRASNDSSDDLAVPTPTLPLASIASQSYASTLKTLTCNNRRKDRSITLPGSTDEQPSCFQRLTDLGLEGCQLLDSIPVTRSSDPSPSPGGSPGSSTLLFSVLSQTFTALQTLNLSYNVLTSASVTESAVSALVLASPSKAGLRHLLLRGNRIDGLDGFVSLANRFKGNREVPEYKLEELDVRDNEISKLPPELGLLPLDVFLVEGNIFRVPQRRIWEREGSRGLLSWLRGRIE